ncbi:hypothetical protein QNH98_01365 [Myroides sp. mNGS23_01]|nr:hypothetical protein [Myroides sp. mNGS23_01]WHT39385.1 hypothetical protein QNH98_01365 [Myroides sp. mNGS23_01]
MEIKYKKNTIYFKTPYQIVSWDFDPDMIKKYAVVFTESFIDQHSELANIIFDFSFFQLDKTIPLHVSETDVAILSNIFEDIYLLYQTKSSEQFNLIATYVKILLLHIRQIYEKSLAEDRELALTIDAVQDRMIQTFFQRSKRSLILYQIKRKIFQ